MRKTKKEKMPKPVDIKRIRPRIISGGVGEQRNLNVAVIETKDAFTANTEVYNLGTASSFCVLFARVFVRALRLFLAEDIRGHRTNARLICSEISLPFTLTFFFFSYKYA